MPNQGTFASRWAVLAMGFFICQIAVAQQIPELEGPFGGLTSPDIIGEAEVTGDAVELEAAEEGWSFRFIPGYISADETSLVGGTLQTGYKNLQLGFRYLNVDPKGTDSLGQVRAQGKYKIRDKEKGPKVAVVGSFTDLEDVYDQINLGFSLSQGLGEKVTLTASLSWSDRNGDDGTDVDDIAAALGIEFGLSQKIFLGVDYTLENDINNDDDYSGTLTFLLPRSSALSVGAGEGDVYFGFLAVTF